METATKSPVMIYTANELFKLPYVKGVYICNNFVTLTKEMNYQWEDIMLKGKEFIKEYVESGNTVINEGFAEAQAKLEEESTGIEYTGDEAELVKKIKELINTYVKPAVVQIL